ncbi:hypothetical protein [Oerskovia paurometabola]|uniref:hypothetical protein n=1 Tax=Oerskovia paurometabola TaxID=162170 RepID=UPI00344A6E7D
MADAIAVRPPIAELMRSSIAPVLVTSALLMAAAVLAVEDRWLMAALIALAPIAAIAAVVDV